MQLVLKYIEICSYLKLIEDAPPIIHMHQGAGYQLTLLYLKFQLTTLIIKQHISVPLAWQHRLCAHSPQMKSSSSNHQSQCESVPVWWTRGTPLYYCSIMIINFVSSWLARLSLYGG